MGLPQEQRSFLGVLTNDIKNPEHTGGIEYVPVVLESLASALDGNGEVTGVTATFKMQLEKTVALISAEWPPSETQGNTPIQHIREIKIYATPQVHS